MTRLATAALLALACLAFWPSPAMAADAPTCQPLVVAQAETAAEAKVLGGEVITLSGREAEKYLAAVNAIPPVSYLKADVIMILVVPNQGAVLGLVEGENVCIAGHIGSAVHYRALKASKETDT